MFSEISVHIKLNKPTVNRKRHPSACYEVKYASLTLSSVLIKLEHEF